MKQRRRGTIRLPSSLLALLCFAGPAVALDSLQTAAPTADNQDFLRKAAFYERDGQLEITDTTLRFDDGAFWMDKARYRAVLAPRLGDKAPLEYRYENHWLAFTPTGLTWSSPGGEKIALQKRVEQVEGTLIANAQEVEGSDDPELAGKGLIYENAYGKGLHLGVLTKNLVFRKTVRFDGLERLGSIPPEAEVLEVGFELGTSEETLFKARFGGEEVRFWDRKETVVARGEPVEFGEGDERSFIQPAHAWDSAGHQIALAIELSGDGERMFLTKRIPVAWLKEAVFPVYADVDLTFGGENVFNAATTWWTSVTNLDSTHVVIAYNVNDYSLGSAVVGTISGSTISFGPVYTFGSGNTQLKRLSATTLDSTHFVIAYKDGNPANIGTAIVGQVSGTTITFGTPVVFNPANTWTVAATALDSTHVAIVYQDNGNGTAPTAVVGTITLPTTISFGLEYPVQAGGSTWISADALDSTHVLIAYADTPNASSGTAVVGTISGTTITYGAEYVFNAAATTAITPTALDGSHLVIAFGNAGAGTAVVGTISGGTVITFGTPAVYNTASGYNIATTLDGTHVAIAYEDGNNSNFGTAVVGSVSLTQNAISFGAPAVWEPGAFAYPSATALDSAHMVVTYQDGDNFNFGTAVVGDAAYALDKLIGFETGDTSEMVSSPIGTIQTATVRPGSGTYYLKDGGTSTLATLSSFTSTIGVRFSFRKPVNPSSTQNLLIFRRGVTPLWYLQLRTDGRLQVQEAEALGLGTISSALIMPDNLWFTVRLVYDSAAGGILRVWVGQSLVIDVTHAAAGTAIDTILDSGAATPNEYLYDDFWISESVSPPPLGQIVARVPNGAGSLTQFDTTAGSATHYLNVDEIPAGDADYNQHAAASAATDLYALANSPAGTINAVKGMWRMWRSGGSAAGGTHDYAWRENGTNRSVAVALTTTPALTEVVWASPPNSGGSWTTAKFDALELGASHNGTQGQDTFISWTVAMVDYDNGTTAVTLASFTATGYDGEVLLEWQTASELNNLGFHLYRAEREEGPYERITATPIPGLGSSPSGARYRYLDSGLTNGRAYFYKLEDIETTGKTELHGPVSATPVAGDSSPRSSSSLTYGDPSAGSLELVERSPRQVVFKLTTGGFFAEPKTDGSVRLSIPGFSDESEPGAPAIPVKRSWVEVMASRGVHVASVRAEDVQVFSSLRPMAAEAPEVIASRRGTVRAGSRSQLEGAAFRGAGLYPGQAALVRNVGYQSEVKKALLEMAPLRWDRASGQLLLARTLTVRLVFSGREEARHQERGSHQRRSVGQRLLTRERGLYGVTFEQVFEGRRRGVPTSSLRLSRLGEAVAFHVEPDNGIFGPGSTMYFISEGESLNPYGHQATYELELEGIGRTMPVSPASPTGAPVAFYWQKISREENRYYQAGLLEAEDLWLWDLLFAPVIKSYPFALSELAPISEPSRLTVWLQGVSDFPSSPDHHLRVSVNGTQVGESTLEGKEPLSWSEEIPAGVLREGENELSIENVGDTGAEYSMVMLDRFALSYPRRLIAQAGKLEGSFTDSGVAEVEGLGSDALVLDVTEPRERWLGFGGRFRVESGRSYLVLSPQAVLAPEVVRPLKSRLKSSRNQADYLIIGPTEFLDAARDLLELRRRQGLRSQAVSLDEIYSEFGFGEPRPEALREFLAYAYQHWQKPAPRYVLLLGDGSYDFKDYLQTGVKNQVPPLMVKTSYLWTASDPTYAAVNGEDILPDVAIGRLPAANVEEARAMVHKVLAYEQTGSFPTGSVVLVADNGDAAGDFEANAEEIASTLFASRTPRKIYLGQLGTEATRSAIVEAFDRGASLLSYVGHGGIQLWANENIFNSSQVAGLSERSQQPLVLTLNCLNGYFHFPYFNSLAEELVKMEGKGAIAAFSPTGLSLNDPAHLFHKALLAEVLSGKHSRLGDAVAAAQADYAASGAFPELLQIYHLLGDPALRLR